eukprot:scaffold298900_cov33-Tisochrysis_lutea.AAC.2
MATNDTSTRWGSESMGEFRKRLHEKELSSRWLRMTKRLDKRYVRNDQNAHDDGRHTRPWSTRPLATCEVSIDILASPGYRRIDKTNLPTWGSVTPVGRTTSSVSPMFLPSPRVSWSVPMAPNRRASDPGVADTSTARGTRSQNSSSQSGRLSSAEGNRNPCSTRASLRARSPACIAASCGTVTCDSSTISNQSSCGK